MSDDAIDKMVLRTLYLPIETDQRLRSIAFTRDISKSELMREFIEDGLNKVAASGERTLAERLDLQAAEARAESNKEIVEKLTPAVPIRKSVTPDHIISLEDGKPYKSLKRHLTGRGLTPDQYREKWGLPPDYPMVAATYAAQRSELAKSIGLGQIRGGPAAKRKAEAQAETVGRTPRRKGPKKSVTAG